MILQSSGELPDRTGEDQVEEQLQPARPAFVAVVAIGGAQRWRAEPDRGASQIADPAHVPDGLVSPCGDGGVESPGADSSLAELSAGCFEYVLHGAVAIEGLPPGLGPPEGRVAGAGAQPGQHAVPVGGPWHAGVQPAPAACSQQRAGGRQQAHGMLGIVPAVGQRSQCLE